jgi:Uma2 family endonuclease
MSNVAEFESQGRKHYTYRDLKSWPEGLHVELIYGIPYLKESSTPLSDEELERLIAHYRDSPFREESYGMAPPSTNHQLVCGDLFSQIKNFLKGKPCKVFAAPFGVKLFPARSDEWVGPDISVICDNDKLTSWGCNGAPDLIIEILSPSSSRKDLLQKLNLYLKAKVREYWIVDPSEQSMQVYVLNPQGDSYSFKEYDSREEQSVPVFILSGCEINLAEVFAG